MFRRLIYLAVIVLISATGSIVQAALPEWEAAITAANPLHWYKFDETGTDCIDSGSGGLNGIYEDVVLGQEGRFGPGTAVGFERSGSNRANFSGATDAVILLPFFFTEPISFHREFSSLALAISSRVIWVIPLQDTSSIFKSASITTLARMVTFPRAS